MVLRVCNNRGFISRIQVKFGNNYLGIQPHLRHGNVHLTGGYIVNDTTTVHALELVLTEQRNPTAKGSRGVCFRAYIYICDTVFSVCVCVCL